MMKALVVIVAVAVLWGTAAHAADPSYGTAIPPGLNASLSHGVRFAYKPSADGSGYIAGTYNINGNRTYGSSSGEIGLFASRETNTPLPPPPSGASTADFSTGTWTPL